MNRYKQIEDETYQKMISNGLFIEPSRLIGGLAAKVQMLTDKLDILESKQQPTDKGE